MPNVFVSAAAALSISPAADGCKSLLCSCARNWIEWRDDLSATSPFDGLKLSQIPHYASEVVIQRCGKSLARGANLGYDGVIRNR